ncbi:WD domain, Gbeta repeat-containing protein, partial [Acanthamoeba castellanii str. Neff]
AEGALATESPTDRQPLSSSPSSSPPKKKTQCGDRNLADDFEKHAALLAAAALSPTSPTSPPQLSSSPGKESMSPYELVLRSELLGETKPTKSCRRRLFQYKPDGDAVGCATTPATSESPISKRSQELLRTPPKTPRKIATSPFRVLEVPAIRDDFYLNLVHWSSQNILAVGLGNCVYLWNAGTGQVTNLCELAPSDPVTSVNWNARGTHLAVGTNKGVVQQWDVAKRTKIREFGGHVSRIGALSWRDSVVTSGSRDRLIINRDVRERSPHTSKLIGHRQEVCGLQWSPDHQFLASGGNDNRLLIWDPVQAVDTGSQVCNLVWSVSVNELVSTHGYSQNQVAVWSYPTMTQIATLTGHATRVLYLSMSPDGQTIVTGAGDETLRFWNVFPPTRTAATLGDFGSLSFGSMQIR